MAIKIVKRGRIPDLRKKRRFVCDYCGCVFDADPGDYTEEYDPGHQQYDRRAYCPTCGRTASENYELD